MAHTCPECGCTCHCHEDWGDIVIDTDENFATCTHCMSNLDEDDFIEEGKNYYGDDLP
jgi:hypothetical protein